MKLEFNGSPQEVKDEMVQFHEVFGGKSEIVLESTKVVAATTKPKPVKKEEPKLEVVKSVEEEPQKEETKDVKEETITMAQVRKTAGAWMKENPEKRAEFKSLLADQFNITKVPELKEEQFEDFLKALDEL